MTWDDVKQWVVRKAVVTSPYKEYWAASVTLGGLYINCTGVSIEQAYVLLTEKIFNSGYLLASLTEIKSRSIV